jgi:hypothetical protein
MERITRDTADGSAEHDLRALAEERVMRRRHFRIHLFAHLVTSLFLVLIWAITEYDNAGGLSQAGFDGDLDPRATRPGGGSVDGPSTEVPA